jgi:hypothetical protein
MATHVPTESKLLKKLSEEHPEKLYAFESYYLMQLKHHRDNQPRPDLALLLEPEIERTIGKLKETSTYIGVAHHEHWEPARSGIPLNYVLVRPLSDNWADSLRQAPSKHEIYHLTTQEKANVRRDAYFFAMAVGAIAIDPDHV